MDVVLMVVLVVLIVLFAQTVKVIQQGKVGLIEFLGKYQKTTGAGLTFIIPGIQRLRKIDIREQMINVPEQEVITADNVGVTVDGVVYVQINDPYKATYEINNVLLAVVNLAQTNLRSVLGTMSLDETLSNRDMINKKLKGTLDEETLKWGVTATRVEIKRLDPPMDIQQAMSKQMKAEREKRAQILEAEGIRESQILKAEGEKKSSILEAEGAKESAILRASGEANAIEALAKAEATKIELESNAAEAFFKGNAVKKEQLDVIENALKGNTKYILDSDILQSIGKSFGMK